MTEQRTEAWFADKNGRLSASRVYDIIPGKRGSYLESRNRLMWELLAERITGKRTEKYVTAAMQWGIDQEKFAKAAYEASYVVPIDDCGFILHPTIPGFGASPDGLIGPDGVWESKSPTTVHTLQILATGEIDPAWHYQCQTQMACTGRDYCDFTLWDPRLPAPLDLTVKRIYRDRLVIELLEHEAKKFLEELQALEDKIKERIN